MISGWLIKIVLGIAAIGFGIIELGSPLIAQAQADDSAHAVADAAGLAVQFNYTPEALQAACAAKAVEQEVELVACELSGSNEVSVTVRKVARSYLLKNFEQTKKYYVVEKSATAQRI